jgi:hypothetical protein
MLLDTILKGNPPSITPANFGLIWFSGFSREDLDVICYQNMHNLHNGYKLVKRKISQKKIENSLKPQNQIKPNLAGMVLRWVPFKLFPTTLPFILDG